MSPFLTALAGLTFLGILFAILLRLAGIKSAWTQVILTIGFYILIGVALSIWSIFLIPTNLTFLLTPFNPLILLAIAIPFLFLGIVDWLASRGKGEPPPEG